MSLEEIFSEAKILPIIFILRPFMNMLKQPNIMLQFQLPLQRGPVSGYVKTASWTVRRLSPVTCQ